VEQGDHRARGFLNDLLDQAQCVVRAFAEPDERDVGSFPGRDHPDVFDIDLPGDHLVTESGNDRRHERQAILPLVRDQHSQMIGLSVAHQASANCVIARRLRGHRRSPASALFRDRLVQASPKTLGGQPLPAPTLGRRNVDALMSTRNATVRSDVLRLRPDQSRVASLDALGSAGCRTAVAAAAAGDADGTTVS
jgi:hypothetical protein